MKLEEPIAGTAKYARTFSNWGPRDSKGRSLRDFDLKTRLFRYPVSFLVYTEAFDNLPATVKQYLYRRLHEVLTARELEKDYTSLAAADRVAMLEILRETKPEFRAWLENEAATKRSSLN
jgi:hypothetical protein